MAATKRRALRSTSKPAEVNVQTIGPDNAPPVKRARKRGTSQQLSLRKFVFEDLPVEIRQRVYHFLGFPVANSFQLDTDMWLRYNTTIALREMYKVDLDADGKLSVPWNVSDILSAMI